MSVVLADLGGTNLRLARAENLSAISTFLISDYLSFESVLDQFAPDASVLYLASAVCPLDDIIEDTRRTEIQRWRIDLMALHGRMKVIVLNDLEAAAYGLPCVDLGVLPLLLAPSITTPPDFSGSSKILIGIGTGIGHAIVFEKPDGTTMVQQTAGGWIVPFSVTSEQHAVIDAMRDRVSIERDLVMEDFASGRGLWTMREMMEEKKALRLFWEFLGLYCNTLATTTGSYGGLCLSGGIIDDMVENDEFDQETFREFFIRPSAPSVVKRISSTPVWYCHNTNLPILGLAEYRKVHG